MYPARRLSFFAVLAACAFAAPAFAQEDAPVVADRVAVRFVAPETGGAARPRFLTERELGFFTRLEAQFEQTPLADSEYPERYVRSAVDRLVARTMLASLQVQRGVEPPDLGRLALEGRADLEARRGGEKALAELMKREGIEDEELLAFLRDQARAAWYVDRTLTPILVVSEDALREAYRTTLHPFRNQKFDEARVKLRRWLVVERLRAAEIEFLQSARARVRIVTVSR